MYNVVDPQVRCGRVGTDLTGVVDDAVSNCLPSLPLNVTMLTRTTRQLASTCVKLHHAATFPRWSSTLTDERALAGIKVVDLTRVLAGPLATMMLVSHCLLLHLLAWSQS